MTTAYEMIMQNNTNLQGSPFRKALFEMYRLIAKHLEEAEGRVFDADSTKKESSKIAEEETQVRLYSHYSTS